MEQTGVIVLSQVWQKGCGGIKTDKLLKILISSNSSTIYKHYSTHKNKRKNRQNIMFKNINTMFRL